MKLSEAIRLGSMMKPQAFDGTSVIASCALRAACEATGIWCWGLGINYHGLQQSWPFLTASVPMPTDGVAVTLLQAIFTLNDEHRWTRERIADWVESIEQQQERDAVQSLSLLAVGIE